MSANNDCTETNSPLIDHRFGVPSYEQYLIDNAAKGYKKLCMTEIMNADMSIATFGEEQYYTSCAEILAMGNVAYKQMGIDNVLFVYAHTYKTFMVVATDDMSDEDFYNLMKANHEQYELITAQQTGLGGVSRFVLSFGHDLVNRAKSAYYANMHLQNNFIVAKDEKEQLLANQEQNAQLFELINYAINNDKVIPFYQGIYSNAENKITKYETLMRICDRKGKVYPPGMFLEEAKRVKLYLPLSKIIIHKALKDFEDKESELSINISLLDIQSEEFNVWILERLRSHPHPQRVVLEFVETENYNRGNELFEFLAETRKIGCKVAVDDFGVGFATYSSIISLRPDIIKIDGDIISTLHTSENSKIILKSIKYTSELIGAQTTAEFVENAEIQDIVAQHGVDYSQGYHFAKPMPKEELNIL